MEQLLRFLPERPQPWWVRYGITALVIVLVFLIRAGSGNITGPYGFVLFVVPILAASIIFNRGSGFFATILAVLLVCALVVRSNGLLVHAPALVVFVFVGFTLSFAGESLRKVAEQAVRADREKDLLLRELNHRIKNTFGIIQAILRLQGRSGSQDVRDTLGTALNRCSAIFHAHDFVSQGVQGGTVEMQSYLTTLGTWLADGLRDVRPIAINVDAEVAMLPSAKAEPVGLIVNELVTNAFKYAFPNNTAGVIQIRFFRQGQHWRLEVADNGVGCPTDVKPGLGTTLIQLLSQQLGARLQREDTKPGCRVIMTFEV